MRVRKCGTTLRTGLGMALAIVCGAACQSSAAAVGTGAEGPTNHSPPAEWSYTGKGGPSRWGALHPAFAECGKGNFQSPIDIPTQALTTRVDDLACYLQTTPCQAEVVRLASPIPRSCRHGRRS